MGKYYILDHLGRLWKRTMTRRDAYRQLQYIQISHQFLKFHIEIRFNG